MARFLIDEDLPKAVSRELRAAGHDARGVRDIGLQGTPDPGVYAHARDNSLVLVTADVGLADPFDIRRRTGCDAWRRGVWQ